MKTAKTILLVFMMLLVSNVAFSQTTIQVTVAQGLNSAIDFANANPGAADIIELVDSGMEYELAPVEILVPMTITGVDANNPPIIKAAPGIAQNDYITVDEDLTMNGVVIDGREISGTYSAYKYMFKVNNVPADNPINLEPELVVTNCTLRNVYANGDPNFDTDGNIFDISRTSYAAKVHFIGCTIENTGDEGIRSINAHKTPVHPNGTAIGSLVIRDVTFNNINGSAVKVESDGDSTTYDGELIIENVTFYNCLRRVIWERDYANSIMRNLIIANSKIGNDTFGGTDALISYQREGSVVANIDTFNISGIKANGDTVRLGNRPFRGETASWSNAAKVGDVEWSTVYEDDPMFADAANGDFTLQAGSPCYRQGHDGGPIGDRRWATNPPGPKTVIQVTVAQGLNSAIDFANANPGAADIIELVDDGGEYNLMPVAILVPMELRGLNPSNPPVIKADAAIDQNDFITVDHDLTVSNVIVDGQAIGGTYAKFKYMFKVNNPIGDPADLAPRLTVRNSTLRNVYRNGDPANDTDGSFFDISTNSWAGAVHFEGVLFENSGDEGVRSINAHKTPVHPNNGAIGALVIRDCTFSNINGSAVKIESDGDSLTADSPVLIDRVTFYNCQRRVIWERDHEYSIFRNLIITDSRIGNDTFGGTDALISFQRVGSVVSHVDTFNIAGIKANGDTVVINEAFRAEAGSWSNAALAGDVRHATIYNLDPMFADPMNGDWTPTNSGLDNLAYDGGLLGDRTNGQGAMTGIIDDSRISSIADRFTLDQNYPNPFNPVTTIRYSIQKSGHVSLKVYNILGELVETLVDEVRPVGEYQLIWNASNQASGMYFYQLQFGNELKVKKMMLLK